jgi:hypothetical protein
LNGFHETCYGFTRILATGVFIVTDLKSRNTNL